MITIHTTADKVNEGIILIQEQGGLVVVENGMGSVSFKGVKARFQYKEGVLSVDILDKPWLATEGMIKDELNKFFK